MASFGMHTASCVACGGANKADVPATHPALDGAS